MLTIPGKTFLVGEYAVLVGGEALGIATNPVFSLETKSPNEIIDYHAQSAVGLFCIKNDLVFNRKIINPYGVGGFGQSTAEFIFAWFEKNKIDLSPQIIPEIFNDYIDLFYSDKLNNKKPSGADLIIQLLGQITYFNPDLQKSKSVFWPFPDLSFFVISTGLKINTHDHLENLDRDCLKQMPEYSKNVIDSFFEQNQDQFISHLQTWSEKLNQLSLQHSDVLKIKQDLSKYKEIIFIKPSGAMGADVCIVFCKKHNKQAVSEILINEKISIQSDETNLSPGVLNVYSQSKELV